MKEEIYMSLKTIRVLLLSLSPEKDVLRFEIDEGKQIDVNLNEDSCQNALKEVFSSILETILEYDVKLEYQVSEGYERQMYIEVCKEYVDDLNRELKETAGVIRQGIKK